MEQPRPPKFVDPISSAAESAGIIPVTSDIRGPAVCLVQLPVGSVTLANARANYIQEDAIAEEEARRRRELLERRPSYRQILCDLSSSELDMKGGGGNDGLGGNLGTTAGIGVANAAHPGDQLSFYPVMTNPLPPGIAGGLSHGFQLATNARGQLTLSQGGSPFLPASSLKTEGDGRLLMPMSVNADLLGVRNPAATLSPAMGAGYLSTTAGGIGASISPGRFSSPSPSSVDSSNATGLGSPPQGSHGTDVVTQKREIRLLKNREAAKECRRKKKEYVRCLENRVAVLENQNKALIDELKTLKDLYCRKNDS